MTYLIRRMFNIPTPCVRRIARYGYGPTATLDYQLANLHLHS